MRILILCTGNSCRSQMAHGFMQSFDEELEVFSAGTQPASCVNPQAVKVMREVGIDISQHVPQSVEKYLGQSWDYVITVCGGANESCPAFMGKVKHRLHIGFDDPSKLEGDEGFILSEFRRVRDEIKQRFYQLYQEEMKKEMKEKQMVEKEKKDKSTGGLGMFERYLSLWVAACILVGISIGKWLPAIPAALSQLEYYNVSLPIAVLIWLMIYPMMMKIDFQSIKNVGRNPKGLLITCITNWLIKPFTMFGIAWLTLTVVFRHFIPSALAEQYLAGCVLLGAAPCTAMVFVWSYLSKGDAAYTLVQVAVNDLILLVAFVPIVAFLLGIGGIIIPWNTLVLSVVLYVVIPLLLGMITRHYVINKKGKNYFEEVFIHKFDRITPVGLLLTLIILFSFQGKLILENPLHILMIAVPLIIQTFFIFYLTFTWASKSGLPHSISAPAALIGASNFFELAVAVAISLFGLGSGAALATVVGVLIEVPLMLVLVKITQRP